MGSTTATPTSGLSVTNETAKARAIAAEEHRVETALANVSNVTGSTGIMRRPEAAIRNRSAAGVRLTVTMPYSYEYHCDGNAGAVDGREAVTIYDVTEDEARLLRVVAPVTTICDR